MPETPGIVHLQVDTRNPQGELLGKCGAVVQGSNNGHYHTYKAEFIREDYKSYTSATYKNCAKCEATLTDFDIINAVPVE